MNDELKTIKKLYGEEMMHLCRELFPSLLEKEGLLLSILQSNLAPTHSFASDIKEDALYEEFKSWIYSLIDVEKEHQIITNKMPFELMDDAGYILYECKSEEDIQRFKKYYASNEELCTFRGGRLNRCYVFFAVKKNVDEIKRENFKNPKRQDEYGTSVISIQFSKGKETTLSIKNRYNHTVNNPDATFSNDLENIIPGLTKSFEKYFGFKLNKKVSHQGEFLTDDLHYVHANDGKYYRYYLERNGIYFCENNIVVYDGYVNTRYANNPERYIFMDQYILDLKEKRMLLFNITNNDTFIKSINEVGEINKIDVLKNKENGTKLIVIYYKDNKQVKVGINKNNAIIGYENNYIDEIGDDFLCYNEVLSSISLSNVQTIGDNFLWSNVQISSISLPQVQTIGDKFLMCNRRLSSISLPQVQTIGYDFLHYNRQLSSISLPQVQTVGDRFLYYNKQLSSISLPQVQIIGNSFLCLNKQLSNISLPNVLTIGFDFLYNNCLIRKIRIFNQMEKRNEKINNQRNK